MSDFDDYVDIVKKGAIGLIRKAFNDASDDAEEIFKQHLIKSEERLKRWTRLIANGDITEAEYKWLINNQITLGKMRVNTSKVIAKKRAIELRESLRKLFVDSAIKVFL